MSINIELKSKVINVFNYKDIDISSFAVHYEPDLQQIEKELLFLRKKYSEIIEAEDVLKEDIVTLSCKSDNRRFNKESINVIVGNGLFNKELENNLIGMKKAEKKEFTINGDKVSVHINKITRSIIPELTDENVIKWDFEGLKSVKELRKWVIDKQKEKFLDDGEYADMAVACLSKQVVEKSSFILDEGECSRLDQKALEKLRNIVKEQGMSLETMTKEQAEKIIGSSVEDYLAMVKGLYKDTLMFAAIGNKLMKEELHPLTMEDYEKEVKGYAEFKGTDIEEEKRFYTLVDYMIDQYSGYYINKLLKYALNYLVEKEI